MNQITLNTGVKGIINAKIIRDGEVIQETGKHSNLILNQFFTTYTDRNCRLLIGTGTATPVVTDTSLSNPLSEYANDEIWDMTYSVDSVNGILTVQKTGTFTFTLGAVSGNLTELGLANYSGVLFTRALFKDSLGNPTTLTVTASDQLVVDYTLEFNVSFDQPQSTKTYSITDVATEYTIKPYFTNPATIASGDSHIWSTVGNRSCRVAVAKAATVNTLTGAISGLSGYTLVSSAASNSTLNSELSTNDKSVYQWSVTAGISDIVGTHRWVLLVDGSNPIVAIDLGATFTKTGSEVATLTVRTSYSRG